MRAVRAIAAAGLVAGACFLPAAAASADDTIVCRIPDRHLNEISGLTYSQIHDGVIWTHNDSGDGARIYALDSSSCKVLATIRIAGVPGQDIEAIAAGINARGQKVLYVGDIGDNTGQRSTISIYEVKEPTDLHDQTVHAIRYQLRYPQAQDAEALLADPGTARLWIITKGLLGGSVFEVPTPLRKDKVMELKKVGDEGSFITDAAISPDGSRYAVRNYTEARIYEGPPPGRLLSRFPLPDQVQGEALTWSPDGKSIVVASESDDRVIKVDLPADAQASRPVAHASPTPMPSTPSAPTPQASASGDPLAAAIQPVDQLGSIAVGALVLGAVTFIAATIVVVVVIVMRDRHAAHARR